MGYTLNLIIFSIAFAFLIGNVLLLNSNICTPATGDATSTTQTILGGLNNFFGTTSGQAIIAAGSGSILLGTLFFPNPWLIFLGPTIILYGYISYVNQTLTQCNLGVSIPIVGTIQTLFVGIISILFGLAVLSWFKGGPDI